MLELRLAEGLAIEELSAAEILRAEPFLDRRLLERAYGRLRLTATGRLLADAVIRDLLAF